MESVNWRAGSLPEKQSHPYCSFWLVGNDGGVLIFSYLSSSRDGLIHEVHVDIRDMGTWCSCEDAMYRPERREGYVNVESGCKHQQDVARALCGIFASYGVI